TSLHVHRKLVRRDLGRRELHANGPFDFRIGSPGPSHHDRTLMGGTALGDSGPRLSGRGQAQRCKYKDDVFHFSSEEIVAARSENSHPNWGTLAISVPR